MTIPDNIAYDNNINAHVRLLYGHLTGFGEAYVEVKTSTLRHIFKVSNSTIINWLKSLEMMGLIKWHRGHSGNPMHLIYLNGHTKEKAL